MKRDVLRIIQGTSILFSQSYPPPGLTRAPIKISLSCSSIRFSSQLDLLLELGLELEGALPRRVGLVYPEVLVVLWVWVWVWVWIVIGKENDRTGELCMEV